MSNTPLIDKFLGWIVGHDYDIGFTGFSDCNNAMMGNGLVEKFKGWTKIAIAALTGEVRQIDIFNKGDATESTILITETRAYKYNVPTTIVDITDAPFTANQERVFSGQLGDLFIFTNNNVSVKKFNGTGVIANLVGLSDINITLAKTLTVNQGFLLIGNIVESGVRRNKTLVWCDKDHPEIWIPSVSNLAGDIDLDEDQSELLALVNQEFDVIAYKEKSIYRLENVGLPVVWSKRIITQERGLLTSDAIIDIDGIHYLIDDSLDIIKYDGRSFYSLGYARGIQQYLLLNLDQTKISQVHTYHDNIRKEIIWSFPARTSTSFVPSKRFAIVYNYVEDRFMRRDDISTAGSKYKEALATEQIDNLGASSIDSYAGISVDLIGIKGIPRYKPIIGDSNGFIYNYNEGNSFDGLDIDGFVETGDEDFQRFFTKFPISLNTIKQLQLITFIFDSIGTDYDINFKVGKKDANNKNIIWKQNLSCKMNSSNSGVIKPRISGKLLRFRIGTSKAGQYWSFRGYSSDVQITGNYTR